MNAEAVVQLPRPDQHGYRVSPARFCAGCGKDVSLGCPCCAPSSGADDDKLWCKACFFGAPYREHRDKTPTAGPWESDERTGLIDGVMELDHDVDGTRLEMSTADRRLVEAAPDLLDAAKLALLSLTDPDDEQRPRQLAIERLRAALAKAEISKGSGVSAKPKSELFQMLGAALKPEGSR